MKYSKGLYSERRNRKKMKKDVSLFSLTSLQRGKEDGSLLVLSDVPTKMVPIKKIRDVRMNDDTEKCEDDQRGKENSPPRKKVDNLWT